jgi:hypothetical protein
MYNSTYSTDKRPQVNQARKLIYFYMYESHTIEGHFKHTTWFNKIRTHNFRKFAPKNTHIIYDCM